jgi:hypothetical protein
MSSATTIWRRAMERKDERLASECARTAAGRTCAAGFASSGPERHRRARSHWIASACLVGRQGRGDTGPEVGRSLATQPLNEGKSRQKDTLTFQSPNQALMGMFSSHRVRWPSAAFGSVRTCGGIIVNVIRDELAQVIAVALAECVGRKPADPLAQLTAALLLATWTVALIQAHRVFD